MYLVLLLIFFLKISINIGFPTSESLLNDTNSYSLDFNSEYKTGGFDFNGDGKQDFIISDFQTKKQYVFFGDLSRYGGKRPLKASMIDGINGFSIAITKRDLQNYPLSGDINNDGYDEIIIRVKNGQLKIIYGNAGPFKNDFSNFDGIEGFIIDYTNTLETEYAAYQVLCDHNGDGIKDLIFNTEDEVFVLYGLDNGKKFPTNSGKFDINFVSNGTYGHIMNQRRSINFGCGDLNNDNIDDLVILSNVIGKVIFGLKIYPTKYNPVLNGTNGFTMDIKANDFKYILQSGFGDFNGDGLQDMAVANQDSNSIYMIYGKKGRIWESHFDISSGNSSEVVKWVRDVSSPQEICKSMYVGDINGDGISDLSCNVNSPGYTWGVYGTTIKLPSVYDLNIKTSPLFGDCRGFIILNTKVIWSTWIDFNNDGILDVIVYFLNGINYILFGQKTIMSASLNIIDTSIAYKSNGEYLFLESNFNPTSSACNVQFIIFKVLDSIDVLDQLSFSSSSNISSDVVSISNSELQVFNTNRDPNFLQSLSNILYKTKRNSTIVTISITYLNIINDTIKIFTANPSINTTSWLPFRAPSYFIDHLKNETDFNLEQNHVTSGMGLRGFTAPQLTADNCYLPKLNMTTPIHATEKVWIESSQTYSNRFNKSFGKYISDEVDFYSLFTRSDSDGSFNFVGSTEYGLKIIDNYGYGKEGEFSNYNWCMVMRLWYCANTTERNGISFVGTNYEMSAFMDNQLVMDSIDRSNFKRNADFNISKDPNSNPHKLDIFICQKGAVTLGPGRSQFFILKIFGLNKNICEYPEDDIIKNCVPTPTTTTTATSPITATSTTSTATTGTATTATATTSTTTTGSAKTSTATTSTPTTSTATTATTTTTGTQPTVTTTATGIQPLITATTTSPSTHVQQNNTVNNDCICVRGQICLPNSHICVNEYDVYQGESCFQLSCALGYDCIEKSNQIYKCVKQYSCITCADITCKSPHRCILVQSTSQKCKYQPTCSN
ncbi:tenascin X [Tieghemostelium lacteum]|uniref:Tenascin X n=1 Tax=Tieghemostelium lacteum TaxID=361077 RepID=A0A151ZDG6_TIELA|nr:tenascin X [Tieghemostelium lacteum]|eukprot:KYQ92008.1 tenascin X [Tieghemostelium lacteum]